MSPSSAPLSNSEGKSDHESDRRQQRLGALNDQTDGQPDRQLLFLQELIGEHATIAGDIVEIGGNRWAIHGSIPVDGEVLMAEYDTPDQARIVLGKLSVTDQGAGGR